MWSRIEISAADTPIAELGMVGRSEQPEAVSGHLPQHVHPMHEIVYLVTGQLRWWVADEIHHLRAGDIYVTRPGEPHGAVDESLEPCDIFWLQVDLDREHPLGLTPPETSELVNSLSLRQRVARPDPVIESHFERLLTHCLRGHERRSYVLANAVAILDLTSSALQETTNPSEHPAQLDAAILWMRGNLHRRILVQDCADAVGVSLTKLHTMFKQHLGTTPNAWLTRERVDRARELLNTGHTVTDTAFSLGFASSQYFATVFKRYTGHSPREFKTRVNHSRLERDATTASRPTKTA